MPRRSSSKLVGLSAVIAEVLAKETKRLRGNRTQRVAADLVGVARPNYSRYESGTHEPSLSTIIRNVRALGGSPSAVLGRILASTDPEAPSASSSTPAPSTPAPTTASHWRGCSLIEGGVTCTCGGKTTKPRGFALSERKR